MSANVELNQPNFYKLRACSSTLVGNSEWVSNF